MASNGQTRIYRDFAHAPSKVKATMEAVKEQFPEHQLIAVLELHTYSSLNAGFMKEYKGVMDPADKAVVFYSAHALELKRMPPLDPDHVQSGFGTKGLDRHQFGTGIVAMAEVSNLMKRRICC